MREAVGRWVGTVVRVEVEECGLRDKGGLDDGFYRKGLLSDGMGSNIPKDFGVAMRFT